MSAINNEQKDANTNEEETYKYTEVNSFDDLDIPEELLRGIYSHGFEIPSAIQRKAIIPMLEGKDLIAQSQSGTGKTACFLIATMGRIDTSINLPQALILCPNRELAQQIYFNFESFNTYTKIKGALIVEVWCRRKF